jgi:hypothetical protein
VQHDAAHRRWLVAQGFSTLREGDFATPNHSGLPPAPAFVRANAFSQIEIVPCLRRRADLLEPERGPAALGALLLFRFAMQQTTLVISIDKYCIG